MDNKTRDAIRLEILKREVPLYRLAARLDLYPARLGRILRGREPLTDSLAEKIRHAIEAEAPSE
jgi:plasmid maintenance system antidote protein VapI